MTVLGSKNFAVQTNQPAGFLLRVPRSAGAPPGGHECCGDCYVSSVGGGTLNLDCDVTPWIGTCGAMDCVGLSGECTYNETGKESSTWTGNKQCGAACDHAAGKYRVYDYASDNCA